MDVVRTPIVGWIEVVVGSMFSGKSEELIRRMRRAEIAGQRVLIAKPQIDDRYDISHVVSHSGHRLRAVGVGEAANILSVVEGCQVVGIDEAQFFDAAVVEVHQLGDELLAKLEAVEKRLTMRARMARAAV